MKAGLKKKDLILIILIIGVACGFYLFHELTGKTDAGRVTVKVDGKVALYKMQLKEVYMLAVVRILLSGFIFGNYFSIIYSLAGGLLSLTVMALLKKTDGFSVMGVSIAGGVFHNVGQMIVAVLVVETFSISYYLPVLMIAGLVTGLVIGLVADGMLKRLTNLTL